MHLDHREKPGHRILGVPVSIFIFSIVLIGIVVGATLVSQQIGISVKVINPNLSVSVTSLAFGTIRVANSVTPAVVPTFTITNNGDTSLLLSYAVTGTNWPSWAIIHLTKTAIYPAGTTIAGEMLAPAGSLTVYAAIEITAAAGIPGDYSGTITVDGSA